MESIGARVQGLEPGERALVIARVVSARSERGEFAPVALERAYVDLGIPLPSKISNSIASLQRRDWLRTGLARGTWKLTPAGKVAADGLMSEMDLASLAAEAAAQHGPALGGAVHSVIPPSFAPAGLVPGLRRFLDEYPFDTNAFAMTRFPQPEESSDPVASSIDLARAACRAHGLQLHLASDRAIEDDLWANVAAHMWASRYGIAFFEDRVGRGLNYNLNIEVGSMLMTGRRCALLKDQTIARMPTDFVGRIYKDVDLDSPETVERAVHSWLNDDLGLGACPACRP